MKLIVNENSYLTLEESDDLVKDEYTSTSKEFNLWASLTDNDKSVLIGKSTRLLESSLLFLGRKKDRNQKLSFPRMINHKVIEVPYAYKVSILVQAIKDFDQSNKREKELKDSGIKTYTVEGASVTFRDSDVTTKNNMGVWSEVLSNLAHFIY